MLSIYKDSYYVFLFFLREQQELFFSYSSNEELKSDELL